MSVSGVHDVSIRYLTGDFKDIGLKEYVMRRLTKNYHVNAFRADKNIIFSLEKGEMPGIIDSNGAGKSTLLDRGTAGGFPTVTGVSYQRLMEVYPEVADKVVYTAAIELAKQAAR